MYVLKFATVIWGPIYFVMFNQQMTEKMTIMHYTRIAQYNGILNQATCFNFQLADNIGQTYNWE